jgi:hypothetical protein
MTERQIIRNGVRWSIHEIDSSRVPGARRASCLIFECDGIVRRVWEYDADWAAATDDALWAIVEPPNAARGNTPSGRTGEHSVAAAHVVAERARSLLLEVELMREAGHMLRIDQADTTERCRLLRVDMRQAIAQYAEVLRADGVPPERALILLKTALKDGLGACDDPGDATAEQLLHDGVDWAIDAYYAA